MNSHLKQSLKGNLYVNSEYSQIMWQTLYTHLYFFIHIFLSHVLFSAHYFFNFYNAFHHFLFFCLYTESCDSILLNWGLYPLPSVLISTFALQAGSQEASVRSIVYKLLNLPAQAQLTVVMFSCHSHTIRKVIYTCDYRTGHLDRARPCVVGQYHQRIRRMKQEDHKCKTSQGFRAS